MTPREHATRAMLLGLRYRRSTHTYQSMTASGSWWHVTGALDADTLEPYLRGQIKRIEATMGRDNRVLKEDTNYDD